MSRYTDLAMERRACLNREGKPVYNCCQTVVSVFAQDAGYDEAAALRAATHFRGGMQMGAVCGAITGSLMVMGFSGVDDPEALKEMYGKILEKHENMMNCRDLLRVNAERGGEKLPHCNAIICECIRYTEEILRKNGVIKSSEQDGEA